MTESPRKLNWSQVVGAAFGGFVLEWVVIVGSFSLTPAADSGGAVFLVVGFLALPLLCAVLLISPRTRVFGASVLIGLILGSIVGAGVCAGFLVSLE
jgi:hypothetical protein